MYEIADCPILGGHDTQWERKQERETTEFLEGLSRTIRKPYCQITDRFRKRKLGVRDFH